MTTVPNGYEPRAYGPERRALYDARRQVAGLEDEVEALIAEVGTLQDQVAALQSTPWIPLPFFGTWRNYDPSGATYELCSYRKIGDIVHVRGLAGSNGTDTTIGYLPAGHAPLRSLLWATYLGTASGDRPSRFDIHPSGGLVVSTQQAIGPYVYVSINCQFSVAP